MRPRPWLPKLLNRSMTLPELRMRALIVQHLEQGNAQVRLREVIGRLAEVEPRDFAAAAMSLIDAHEGESVARMLADILMETPDFINYLCEPGRFERGAVLDICRGLMQLNPLFDVKLARLLPSRRGDESRLEIGAVLCALDMLDEISDGPRLVLLLNHLAQHADERIASKALLLLGSRFRNRHWLKRHVNSADPRARANLIEGLWGDCSQEAKKTFHECLKDTNSRVVGNAMVGLLLAGERDVGQRARQMLRDERPSFRWTAAWVLGRTGKAENLPELTRALEDADPGVRVAAQRAIAVLEAGLPAPVPVPQAPEPVPPAVPALAVEEVQAEPAEELPAFEIHLDGHFARRRNSSRKSA